MRHRKAGIKLNRSSSHRQAMFRNMVTSLLKHDRIKTTDVKAKELRRWADHIITLAKRGDLGARRQALAIVREKAVVHKIFEEAQERFGKINGGYTRIVKIGLRPGDAAPISMIELVEAGSAPKKKKKKSAAKKKAEAPKAAAAATAESDAAPADADAQDATTQAQTEEPAESATDDSESASAKPADEADEADAKAAAPAEASDAGEDAAPADEDGGPATEKKSE